MTTLAATLRSKGMETTAPATLDLAQLATEHQATVWRYLRLLGCPAALADDLTQETFLCVIKKPFVEINARATAAYLRLVARNLFIDEMRRQKKSAPADLDQADLAWEEIAGTDEGESWREALRECLGFLEGRARQAVDLRYRDNASISAIAGKLAMKSSGVKTLLGRVKTRLRDCVERKVRSQ